MSTPSGLSRTLRFLRTRTRVGFSRSRKSFPRAVQITVCAVGAYAFAEHVLGHQGPLFAATSALISLGFSREPRLRRVIEVAAGCTLGIAVGDLLLHALGPGYLTAALVLLLSVLLARFLDSGGIFTTQLGLQALLVVLLPAPAGGPFTRSLDAVVGGVFALVVTFLIPRDPRREPQTGVREILNELSQVLRESAMALEQSDSTGAWHALVRARNTQPLLDSLRTTLRSAREVTRLSPTHRRHLDQVNRLDRASHFLDLAVRNSRVVTRRITSVINHASLTDPAIESVSAAILDTADAVNGLAMALSDPDSAARDKNLRRARNDLAAVATRLHPQALSITGLEGEGLVLLMRPMIVDLLEATGLPHEEAADFLPRLAAD
jgi:uncharacterized membrane protein YgaE (UPF0421/DUF939 family)